MFIELRSVGKNRPPELNREIAVLLQRRQIREVERILRLSIEPQIDVALNWWS
jgi:hypothetical protein